MKFENSRPAILNQRGGSAHYLPCSHVVAHFSITHTRRHLADARERASRGHSPPLGRERSYDTWASVDGRALILFTIQSGVPLKRLIAFVAAGILLSSHLLIAQSLIVSTGKSSGDLVAAGDALVKEFSNEKALQKYLEALSVEPNNVEILWRISRAYVDIGEHMPAMTDAEKKAQLQTYEKAVEYAERAVQANPRHSMAYTRRAIANGRIALFRGVWESLDLVKKVKADLEKAINLDPNNDVAHYVLARTHAKVSERPRVFRWPLGLSWATINDAIRHYEIAISLKPDFIMYRLDCARAYLEADMPEKARIHLQQIESLPTLDEDDDQFRKEARELTVKLGGK